MFVRYMVVYVTVYEACTKLILKQLDFLYGCHITSAKHIQILS